MKPKSPWQSSVNSRLCEVGWPSLASDNSALLMLTWMLTLLMDWYVLEGVRPGREVDPPPLPQRNSAHPRSVAWQERNVAWILDAGFTWVCRLCAAEVRVCVAYLLCPSCVALTDRLLSLSHSKTGRRTSTGLDDDWDSVDSWSVDAGDDDLAQVDRDRCLPPEGDSVGCLKGASAIYYSTRLPNVNLRP